jgi:signal peptidase
MGIRQAALVVMAAVVGVFIALLVRGELQLLTVRGRSMVPTYEPGDLVATIRQRSYQEGQIAAYREPTTGKLYIHRLVRREGGRWVLKGDGNDWEDSYRPREDEIVGRAILHIRGLGEWLHRLRSPVPTAALISLALVLGTGAEARRRARGRRRADAGVPSWPAPVLLCGGAAGIVALLLGAPAFMSSASVQVTEGLTYRHEGIWEYFAPGRGSAYDEGGARTGEPVFLALVREPMTVTFRYKAAADRPLVIQRGSLKLTASIGDAARGGWRRTIEVAPAQELGGQEGVIVGRVDVLALLDIARRVREETGLPERQLVLTITAETQVDGLLAGQPFSGSFAPALSFQVDRAQALPVLASSPGGQDPLRPWTTGQVSRQRTKTATLPSPYPPVPVPVARWAAAGLGIAAAVLLGISCAAVLRLTREERQLLFHGDQPLLVESLEDLGLPMVQVRDRRRLLAAAQKGGYIVLVERGGRRTAVLTERVLLVADWGDDGAGDGR